MPGAIGADSNGRGSALLAGDLIRPRGVGGLLRSVQQDPKVSIAFTSAEIPTSPLDLAAGSLGQGDSLGAVGEEGLDPPA